MAFVATPVPTPTIVPMPIVTYTITGGAVPQFEPYITMTHVGPVVFVFVNMDHFPHVYMLRGTSLVASLPPTSTTRMISDVAHPGPYSWVNLVPYEGTGEGATVGVLVVT